MSCPLNRQQVIELYYLEHRAKLLDLAAFLDRLDRAESEEGDNGEDFRILSFREALKILSDEEPGRAKRVLDHFSDPTMEPLESAAGLKGAFGTYPGAKP